MAAYQWIKLYDEILDDPKMGRLSDGAFRMCINLFMLANRQVPRDGRLPSFEDTAWTLRLPMEDFHGYWAELERAGIVCASEEAPKVTHFEERQQATPVAERVRRHRERKVQETAESNEDETPLPVEGNEDVTERYIDKELDKELEIEEEKELSSANADYQAIRQRWLELFPGKSQPRVNNKALTGKVKTRMKSEHFRQNWADALERASHSTFLGNSTFWCLDWFLQNDANYEKCLNGNYDDRGGHSPNGRHPKPQDDTMARLEARLAAAMENNQ